MTRHIGWATTPTYGITEPPASYPGSNNAGAKNRAWYQTYAHALDIAACIPSTTIRSLTNDVFTEDDLLGRRD